MIFVLLSLSSAITASTMNLQTPEIYCGSKLMFSIKHFCEPHNQKMILSFDTDAIKQKNFDNYKGGIIDTCCKKPCFLRTLIKFCPNHGKVKNEMSKFSKNP